MSSSSPITIPQEPLASQGQEQSKTDLDQRIEKVGARATKNSQVIAADIQDTNERIGKEFERSSTKVSKEFKRAGKKLHL